MSDKKSWDDFTNRELWEMLGNTFNWNLSKKIMDILKERGLKIGDLEYGNVEWDATGHSIKGENNVI